MVADLARKLGTISGDIVWMKDNAYCASNEDESRCFSVASLVCHPGSHVILNSRLFLSISMR